MKKLILLIATLLFSYEIINTKTYNIDINNTVLSTRLNITVKDKNLNNLLEKISKIINKSKNICQEANYKFYPQYSKNGDFIYYTSDINLKCQFKKEKVNTFNTYLDNIKNFSKVRLNSINLIPDATVKAKKINKLKEKAYNEVLKEAKTLSKTLNKRCFLSSFSFNSFPVKQTRSYKIMSLPQPIQNNNFKLNVYYKINCY